MNNPFSIEKIFEELGARDQEEKDLIQQSILEEYLKTEVAKQERKNVFMGKERAKKRAKQRKNRNRK